MNEPRKDTAASSLTPGARICPQCGTAFICGLAAAHDSDISSADLRCWCFDLPAVMPVRADTACLCPACLLNAIRQVQEVRQ